MKVKVRVIAPPYTDAPTASLDAILCNHANGNLLVQLGAKQLYEIVVVLNERKATSEYQQKAAAEARAMFNNDYLSTETKTLRIDYAGEYDHHLVELSDVLPASLYGVNAIQCARRKSKSNDADSSCVCGSIKQRGSAAYVIQAALSS